MTADLKCKFHVVAECRKSPRQNALDFCLEQHLVAHFSNK